MRDYTDLEQLLFRGFLTTSVEIEGIPLVIKTWNPKEQELAKLQSFSLSGEEEEVRLYTAFALAYSTLFFAHENILVNRQELLTKVAASIYEWPLSVLKSLMVVAHRLNVRASKQMELVESYTYGALSRRQWKAYQHLSLCDPKVTGIPGTEYLGLNDHQNLWVYFNSVDDIEEQYLRDWNVAKFITSPHAPKDVKRIDDRDSKKLSALQKRRQALFEGRSPHSITENAQVKITNESAEDLMAQMEATVRGEKDFHDYVIEQHQRRVRENYFRQREAAEKERDRILAARRRRAEEEIGKPLTGYTEEEVAHFLAVSQRQRQEGRASLPDNFITLAEREQNLVRWGFLREDDLPEAHRPSRPDPRQEYNPLIQENYRKVAADLNDQNPDWDVDD